MTEPHDTEKQDAGTPSVETAAGVGSDVREGPETASETVDPIDGPAVQREGVDARPIIGFIFMLLLVIAAVVWVGINWAESVVQEAYEQVAEELDYPELRQVELAATRQLNQYELVNAEQGVYRIPIDRAIDLMVNEAVQAPGQNFSRELQLSPGN